MGNHQNQLWTFLRPFFMGPITRDLNIGGVRTSDIAKDKDRTKNGRSESFPNGKFFWWDPREIKIIEIVSCVFFTKYK